MNIITGIAQGLSGRAVIWQDVPEREFESRIYQGIITTLISSFVIKVDYLQPELNLEDKIYIANAESLSGSHRVKIEIEKPEAAAVNVAVQMLETDSYTVKVEAAPYSYEDKCRDIWNITGSPELELEQDINMQTINILSGWQKINAED